MNAARLTCHVLRLSGPLRPTTPVLKYAVVSRFAHQKKEIQDKSTKKPINHDIPTKIVQLVNEEGKLEPPVPLEELLGGVDLKKFYVELVAEDKALVKILNKQEERAKEKARNKAQKARMRAVEQKEIQMTWGVASGDLAHKVGKARKELEKKVRVDLIFAPKTKQPLPPPHEREEKVNEVLEMLKDVGREYMERTFKRSLLTIHLRSIEQ